jgi:hypothetical protein
MMIGPTAIAKRSDGFFAASSRLKSTHSPNKLQIMKNAVIKNVYDIYDLIVL